MLIYTTSSQVVTGISTVPTFTMNPPNHGTCPVTLARAFGGAVVMTDPAQVAFSATVAGVVRRPVGGSPRSTVPRPFVFLCPWRCLRPDGQRGFAIVDPVLIVANVADLVTPHFGDMITYTLDTRHVAGCPVDAFDSRMTDTMPDGMTRVAGSLPRIGVSASFLGTPLMAASWDGLPMGQRARFAIRRGGHWPLGHLTQYCAGQCG